MRSAVIGHILPHPAAYGRGLKAVIDVGLPPAMSPDEFEERLTGREEVTFAAYVTDKFDYTVIVDCNGSEGLDAFIRWLKADAGVAATESELGLRHEQQHQELILMDALHLFSRNPIRRAR